MARDPVNEALLEQAARFRARLADAPRDVALRDRVEAWKAEDSAHAQAFDEAEALWQLMGTPASAVARNRARHWPLAASGLAAALALVIAPAIQRGYDDWRSDAVAGAGERRTVALADGSEVVLNSGTALAFDVDGQGRSVRLYRGEAFFSVAHDPAHPFRIRAGGATVTVLGTRFNIRVDGEETRVTVEQGSVRLEGPAGNRILTAEEQGIAGSAGTVVRAAVSADATAWRRGRAVFYDAPLSRVIADLERYGGGTIYLANPDLRARRITGAFRTDAPQETLQAISESIGAGSLTLPGGVTILY